MIICSLSGLGYHDRSTLMFYCIKLTCVYLLSQKGDNWRWIIQGLQFMPLTLHVHIFWHIINYPNYSPCMSREPLDRWMCRILCRIFCFCLIFLLYWSFDLLTKKLNVALLSIYFCILLLCYIHLKFCFLQLKSSLLLHIDGTSPVAEDIGRQVQ